MAAKRRVFCKIQCLCFNKAPDCSDWLHYEQIGQIWTGTRKIYEYIGIPWITVGRLSTSSYRTFAKLGRSVLVAAPTGTGKTLVADWIVEEAMKQDKYVVYTAPIKALSNQKCRDYCALYGEKTLAWSLVIW